MKFLNNMKGFSLAEVTIAAGMLGIVSLGTMSLMKNQSQSMAKFKETGEAVELKRILQARLTNEDSCKHTLNAILSGDQEIRNRNNVEVPLIFQRIEVTDMAIIGLPANDATGDINFRLKYKKKGSDNAARPITVSGIQISMAGAVVGNCYFDKSAAIETARSASCENLGGTWDDTAKTCALNSVDPAGGDAASVDYVAGLFGSHLRLDGTTPMTGNLDMGGQSITSVGTIGAGAITGTSLRVSGGGITAAGAISGTSLNVGTLGAINAGTINATTQINIGTLPVATKQWVSGVIFENLTDVQKEAILTAIVASTSSQTGVDAISTHTLSKIASDCTSPGKYIKEISSAGTVTCGTIPIEAIGADGEYCVANAGKIACNAAIPKGVEIYRNGLGELTLSSDLFFPKRVKWGFTRIGPLINPRTRAYNRMYTHVPPFRRRCGWEWDVAVEDKTFAAAHNGCTSLVYGPDGSKGTISEVILRQFPGAINITSSRVNPNYDRGCGSYDKNYCSISFEMASPTHLGYLIPTPPRAPRGPFRR